MATGTSGIAFVLAVAIVGLIFVVVQLRSILRHDTGTDQMREIAAAIQEGAAAFLQREYLFLSAFVAVVAVVIALFLNWQTAVAFVAGAVASGDAGHLGMYVSGPSLNILIKLMSIVSLVFAGAFGSGLLNIF
ncbi:MAG TPA: sodium/proton-translocating pyrophosphatase [Anaerolineae bacterium]|nr:sodium/proton-translocating pyrophosphatase [Anaerolineae bacterium]